MSAHVISMASDGWFAERRAKKRRLNGGFPAAIVTGLLATFWARLAGFEAALLLAGSLLVLLGLAIGFVAWLRGQRSELAGGLTFLGFASALLST